MTGHKEFIYLFFLEWGENRRRHSKLMALIPYYERDLIIIERFQIYKYTDKRAKR